MKKREEAEASLRCLAWTTQEMTTPGEKTEKVEKEAACLIEDR